MGLFGPSLPKRVTKEEFRQVLNRLYGELDETERADVEMLFRADLEESGQQSGITQSEFDAGIKWLQDNMNKHVLEDDDIEILKKYFAEHLQD
jgi:truncated hemoglobin YjbI